jgi:hypothetical protein
MGRDEDAQKYFVRAAEMVDGPQPPEVAASSSSSSSSSTSSVSENRQSSSSVWGQLPIMTMQSGDEVTVPFTGGRELLVRCLSSSPKIAIIKQFLTDSECDLIVEESKPHLESSHVMGKAQNSELAQDAYRISENAWLAPGELHPLLPDVQARLSAVTGLPIAYLSQMSEQLQVRADELLWMIYLSVRIQVTDIFVCVCLQVVRYQFGGHFNVHQDSSQFHPRFMTALMYLNSVHSTDNSNGATWFPYANGGNNSSVPPIQGADSVASVQEAIDLARSVSNVSTLPGLLVSPSRGDIVIFVNHLEDESIDFRAVHAGLPLRVASITETSSVETGVDGTVQPSQDDSNQAVVEKWVANYWIGLDSKMLRSLL